nr:hypothetical protein [uncultured Draconibacterium sp.]
MENTYAEKTGENTIAIHCDTVIAERIYEGICKIFAEYPNGSKCNEQFKSEKRRLVKLKKDIELALPPSRPGDKI